MHQDKLSNDIVAVLESAEEPLETKEVEQRIAERTKNSTRTKVLYRLNVLRGDGKIKGKSVGSGKGVWIWWCLK